jgi:hypothetical protein
MHRALRPLYNPLKGIVAEMILGGGILNLVFSAWCFLPGVMLKNWEKGL